jgi:hypothetical protein
MAKLMVVDGGNTQPLLTLGGHSQAKQEVVVGGGFEDLIPQLFLDVMVKIQNSG